MWTGKPKISSTPLSNIKRLARVTILKVGRLGLRTTSRMQVISHSGMEVGALKASWEHGRHERGMGVDVEHRPSRNR